MQDFVHLHCHTQFSLLDGASSISDMMKKAAADGMKAVALTDHGNMFGAFKFVAEAEKNNLKPIVGCEFYLVENRHIRAFSKAKNEQDKRYHQLLLAKNQTGYQNLSKLCSLGFIEGLYSKFPRIDKELIVKYHEGLIATSCCIGAEIPQAIMQGKIDKAEELLKWWIDIFGEDFYIELQRHKGLENIDNLGISQEDINQQLLIFAKKYNLKVIATNDSHYVNEDDWIAHDMLLCINTGSLVEEDKRFRFSSSDFFFKTKGQMNMLFNDLPMAVENTIEIYDKIEPLKLTRDVLLPAFPLPKEFNDQNAYLRHLTYSGAHKRYGHISPEIKERLDFELQVIENSGYPGYFLIVQDFTSTARNLGVAVGPGRGSAAGSAVAYCIGITNVDPIKYDLLFERFLNPERISMPDIDIDFDDVGREKVINYVLDKYGRNQVAQIITYGSMAAKTSLQDVGRVMNISLDEVKRVKEMFPEDLSATLNKVLADGDVDPKLKEKLNKEELDKAYSFRELAKADDKIGEMIQNAKKLEGSIRNTGIHACGVVITPGDITNFVPVTTAKDSDLLVTQFDNSVAESAGLLKMDFLGLKTLTIINDAIVMVKENHGVDIDPDLIPLEDSKTYELFQRGETVGVFQYESAGMQKYMRDLVPTKFEDLIAMNALYRPGPLEYIPEFIDRKHGRKPIVYDLPEMEEYLKETYGITVYQEQVMLLSQKLAGFTKGEADVLRKAMGKKQKSVLDKMKSQFVDQAMAKGHPQNKLEKIWTDWEAFASYAFNKSHSTCYAFVAFQTAYLKAHYPAEFMASVLTHSKSIDDINFFISECKVQSVEVLGPDINESKMNFYATKNGKIRFGMSAVKGVGEGPVEEILRARSGGNFTDIFDVVRRVSLRVANKKSFESLVLSGAFDAFGFKRASFFAPFDDKTTFLEALLRYGNAFQKEQTETTMSLFGDSAEDSTLPEPKIPDVEEWPLMQQLKKEKDVTGFYLSGHPLDDYKVEVQRFATPINKIEEYRDQELALVGIVTDVQHRMSKKGSPFGSFSIEDYESSYQVSLFGENYMRFKHLLVLDAVVYVKGKYAPKWSDPNSYEMRINEIRLLDEVRNEKIKGITINLPVQNITEKLIAELDDICQKHGGDQTLSVNILDVSEKIKLHLISFNRKINADSLLVSSLQKMGLDYKVT
jgi:DNA polymerase-3 subunit alpha